jgi:hypothetical protein
MQQTIFKILKNFHNINNTSISIYSIYINFHKVLKYNNNYLIQFLHYKF